MKNKSNKNISLIIFIALPILSILIGYFGVKWYLLSGKKLNKIEDIPNVEENIDNNEGQDENLEIIESSEDNSKSELKNNESDNSEDQIAENTGNTNEKIKTIAFDDFNFYSIQMGSFSVEENAQKFVNGLVDKNLNAFYVKSNNYKVFAFASNKKEYLEEELELCKKEISDSFIKKLNIKSKPISYYSSESNYLEKIKEKINNHFLAVYSGDFNASDEIENLESIKADIENFSKVNEKNTDIAKNITAYINELLSNKAYISEANHDYLEKYILINIQSYIENLN